MSSRDWTALIYGLAGGILVGYLVAKREACSCASSSSSAPTTIANQLWP